MILVDIFDAAREGDWDAFQKFFDGNVNQVNPNSNYNLLQLAVTSTKNPEGRLAIVRFLLEQGIDLNYRETKTSLDKGIQGKEAEKVLPTLHKTPPNGTIGGVFVCGGKSLNPGRQGMRPKSRQGGICKHGRRNQDQRHAGSAGRPSRAGADGTSGDPRHGRRPRPLRQGDRPVGCAGGG